MDFTDKRMLRLLQGFLLSVVVPLGWALIQLMLDKNLQLPYSLQTSIYGYMFLSSASIFMAFGFYVGKNEERLLEQAVTDDLTGLHNSRYFNSRLPQEFARMKRLRQHLALIYINLDHFSDLNSLYGLAAGDKAIADVAFAMQSLARKDEMIARVSGVEFCVILAHCNEHQAYLAAQRFLACIRQLQLQVEKNKSINITASMGVVSSEMTPGDEWHLYAAADKAMYKAKHRGRNQVVRNSED